MSTSASATASVHLPAVGVVGLGLMGQAISQRLLGAGYSLFGSDPQLPQQAAFAQQGGTVVNSSVALHSQCQILLLSLPNSSITAAVLHELAGQWRPHDLVIDTSTGDPRDALRFATELKALGVGYLDATISGNSEQVSRAEVLTMAGGEPSDFQRARPILEAFSRQVLHVGGAGLGSQMKLVTNLVLGLNRAALAEGLVFAGSLGISRETAFEVLRQSMAYSKIMETKGPKMIAEEFSPQARLAQHLKDVRLILQGASDAGQRLPLSEAHQLILETAVAAGWGELDNSALIKSYQKLPSNSV